MITAAMTAIARGTVIQTGSPSSTPAPGANNGKSARIGITARSWNNRMANDDRPWALASWPFSARICSAKAVDESDSANPTTIALSRVKPKANATAANRTAVTRTWAPPMPKTALRMVIRREGCSSRPMTKRSRTTPNSAKCKMSSTLVTRPRAEGPITTPAAKYPSTEPKPTRFDNGTATMAAARKMAAITRNDMTPNTSQFTPS